MRQSIRAAAGPRVPPERRGRPRYGFAVDRSSGRRVLDPVEAAAVAEIVRLRRAGLPFRVIARELVRQGRRTKRGAAWAESTIRHIVARELLGVSRSAGPKLGELVEQCRRMVLDDLLTENFISQRLTSPEVQL
jgi:hypothetical protein